MEVRGSKKKTETNTFLVLFFPHASQVSAILACFLEGRMFELGSVGGTQKRNQKMVAPSKSSQCEKNG